MTEKRSSAKNRCVGINCSECGRFVGKDGDLDITYDEYCGGATIGYALCRKCLNAQEVMPS